MSKKMKKFSGILILGLLVILLSACSPGAAAEPTQDPNVVFTQVAETVMVSMTQTAEAVPPTSTPAPTITPMPSLTPTTASSAPTATPPQAYPTATTQAYGDAAKWNTQSPVDGTVLDKSENFAFHVCLANTGSTEWTTKYYLNYVSGQQLWWDTTVFHIGETVKPGEKWCFDLPSVAPDKSGEYTTRWYLKNGSGDSFFEVYFHYFVGQ